MRQILPGVDAYWLETAYCDSDKDVAKNEDARFLACAPKFAKSYARQPEVSQAEAKPVTAPALIWITG